MPYQSKAQARLFHYLESKGEIPKKTVQKYDKMTEFEDLPEHVKMALGGIVSEIQDSDIMEHPRNTSGEPHTNEEEEEKKPMEYMAKGGKVHAYKMAHGGQVEHEEKEEKKGMFAKHLAKKMKGM